MASVCSPLGRRGGILRGRGRGVGGETLGVDGRAVGWVCGEEVGCEGEYVVCLRDFCFDFLQEDAGLGGL